MIKKFWHTSVKSYFIRIRERRMEPAVLVMKFVNRLLVS